MTRINKDPGNSDAVALPPEPSVLKIGQEGIGDGIADFNAVASVRGFFGNWPPGTAHEDEAASARKGPLRRKEAIPTAATVFSCWCVAVRRAAERRRGAGV